MKILIVDDELLARQRLRTLLGDSVGAAGADLHEAVDAREAIERIQRAIAQGEPFDVVLLDVQMPGQSGMQMARLLSGTNRAPAVIFVSAHPEHALSAFEVEAVDYLTKPVRLERLEQALAKAQRVMQAVADGMPQEDPVLVIHERNHLVRVPLSEVLYFKAELKYITVRTATRTYVLDGALNDIEQRFGAQFLRIHRNALVARDAIRALNKVTAGADGDAWAVQLCGIDETLLVSRRQLPSVREAMARGGQSRFA